MHISITDRIKILSTRLENLKANSTSDMSTAERVEAIRDTQSALQFAVEEKAREDSLR